MSGTVTVRLQEPIITRLNALSKATERPKSFYVRKLVEEYLEEMEDRYLLEKAIKDVRSGKEKLIPFDRKNYL